MSKTTYTETPSLLARLREASQLLRKTRQSRQQVDQQVQLVIEQCQLVQNLIEQTGFDLTGRRALEIGVGQLPRQIAFFGIHNDVTGIDLDLIPQGFDPAAYLRLARQSGAGRAAKTLARKLLGLDALYQRTMARHLKLAELPLFDLRQMDASRLAFNDASFDFVYSFDVFEHLPDPAAVLKESQRVLRPGGLFAAYIHLYTCDSGHHDLRLYLPGRGGLPFWAHLRPSMQSQVQTYVALNQLRLAEWRDLFASQMPGASLHLVNVETDRSVRDALAPLRAAGELADYSDEELLTDRVIAIWTKPGSST